MGAGQHQTPALVASLGCNDLGQHAPHGMPDQPEGLQSKIIQHLDNNFGKASHAAFQD